MRDPKELREQAARYRRMLASIDDPRTRDVLLKLAEENEAGAAMAEAEQKQHASTPPAMNDTEDKKEP